MSPKRRPGRGFAKAKAPSKPRQVLNLGSVAERVTERRKFGRLQDALIQPSTMVKYQRALAYFFHFLDAGGLELPSSQDDLDDIVCECIEYMWETGEPRSLCGNLLSSIASGASVEMHTFSDANQHWAEHRIARAVLMLNRVVHIEAHHQAKDWHEPPRLVLHQGLALAHGEALGQARASLQEAMHAWARQGARYI